MKGRIVIFSILAILLLCVSAASAVYYDVDTYEISPDGDLTSGESVIVSCIVQIETSGDETWVSGHSLEFYTELENVEWTYQIEVDGVGEDITSGKRYLTFSDWDLQYPDEREVYVIVYLEGNAPEVTATTEKTIMRIREYDKSSTVVSDGETVYTATVINPADIETSIGLMEQELTELYADIEDALARGVDTTNALTQYNLAATAVKNAKTASVSNAKTYLDTAKGYIDEATTLLQQAEATKAISDAETEIALTQDIITYFEVNRSMASDSRVMSLDTQLALAQSELDDANDKYSDGDYISAYSYAQTAYSKATGVYESASALKTEIGEGFALPNLGGIFYYVLIVVIVVIVAIIGIVFYRRYTKWDELG